jgi:hypothetical protein
MPSGAVMPTRASTLNLAQNKNDYRAEVMGEIVVSYYAGSNESLSLR